MAEASTSDRRGIGFLEARPVNRILLAFVAAAAVLSLLLFVFLNAPLRVLPAYPAVLLAFLISVVLPGLFIQRLVLPQADVLVRLAVAPPLGLAVAIPPGLIALERHLQLGDFALMYAVFAAFVCGASMLIGLSDPTDEGRDEGSGHGRWLPAAFVVIALTGVVTLPFWRGGELEGDFDDWTYMAYVESFVGGDAMNEAEPFLGTGESVSPRMRSNVWVVAQALISKAADVPPEDVLLEYLRPLLTVIAVLATYALTRTLFRNSTIALLAAAFLLGYALLDLSPQEGFGRNLFIRISEDKMVGGLILFPAALVFLLRYVRQPAWPAFTGFTLVVLTIAFVHPVPLLFLGIAISMLWALRAWTEKSLFELRAFALLLVPVGVASGWPFVQRQFLIDVAPELFGTEASAITFRDQFHVIELGAGLLIGNYHMILHPLMITGIVLTILIWMLSRKTTANQLLLAITAGPMIVFFTPLLATPVAEIMTPQTLWKLPWMIPVAPILAYATYESTRRFSLPAPLFAVVPGVAMIAVLLGALVVQEQYERADAGAFYTWTSPDAVVPGSESSIFRGGIDRAFSGQWRVPEQEDAMLRWIETNAFEDAVVLAEPAWIHHVMPGILQNIYPVDFGGSAGEGDRRDGAMAFARGTMSVDELEAYLDRYDVDFVIAREVEAASEVLRESERVIFRQEFSPYLVYEVR